MATDPTTPSAAVKGISPSRELRIYSHSGLYYWWPVWFFGFVFALWTLAEDNRMVIVPHKGTVIEKDDVSKKVTITVIGIEEKIEDMRLWKEAETVEGKPDSAHPRLRVSSKVWMGPLYLTILFLVILITNVPLRGLWSLVAIISIALLALTFSLFDLWDSLLRNFGNLHIHMNMGGYLFLAVGVCAAWALAVFFFDRRSYIIFTPGQIRVCEEIGGREKVYDTTGLAIEKHRADWFRHIILGFGTGDLSVKTSGADRHEILMPNVAFIGFKIDAIESMIRSREVT